MLKRHNLVICFITLAFLTFNSVSLAQTEQVNTDVDTSFTTTIDDSEKINVKDLDIEPINTQSIKQDVIPNTKSEGKKVIGLFLKTMLAVLLSGVLIYFVLYFVKKFYGTAFLNTKSYDKEVESLDLATPPTKQDALKSFLKRTK